MENLASAARKRFLARIGGVILLCVTPILLTFIAYLVTTAVGLSIDGVVSFCIGAFVCGIPTVVFGINYLVSGQYSWIGKLYRSIVEEEQERQRELEQFRERELQRRQKEQELRVQAGFNSWIENKEDSHEAVPTR